MTGYSEPPWLRTEAISKSFPGVVANHEIDLTIRRGEIQSILGENGAGKSTLINILSGMLLPDSGEIFIGDQAVQFKSPHEALNHGVGTVYQHFTLVPNLSVLENILLGQTPRFVLNLGQAERQLKTVLEEFGLTASLWTEVRHLPIGQQQRVEIIKALYRGSKILLLDEPTSALTPGEVRGLFEMLRRLKEQGIGVVFITHKLEEALEISDRMVILQQGRCVGELEAVQFAAGDRAGAVRRIARMMFGGAPHDLTPKSDSRAPGRVVLALKEVTARGSHGLPALVDVSLELYAGEIFGVAGVDGNGQKELAEVIVGQRPAITGQIHLKGREISLSRPAAAGAPAVGYVTDDRLGEGCVSGLSVAENLVLKVVNRRPFSNRAVLDRTAIQAYANRLIKEFDIKTPGPWARAATLSGGNIQKLLLARELATDPEVLICHKPTQGLDVKTARFVLRALRNQAEKGKAVLLISAEVDELLTLCDRIGVMYNGRFVDILARSQANREKIGQLMLGGAPP